MCDGNPTTGKLDYSARDKWVEQQKTKQDDKMLNIKKSKLQ